MRKVGIAGVLVGLLAVSAAGQDAVEIKVAYPKAGDRVKVTIDWKSENKQTVTAGGKTVKGDPKVEARALVYVDDVIENPGDAKRPTKLKRTYEKAVVTSAGKEKSLPVEGKTVLIEKKGDAYSVTVDGKPVEGDSLKLLQSEFGKQEFDPRRLLLPDGKIKPGETWKADAGQVAKVLSDSFGDFALDPQKTTAGGTLVKTFRKDGKQFGVIELRIDGPLVDANKNERVKVTDGKLTVSITGNGCIDGKAPMGDSQTAMRLALTLSSQGAEVLAELNVKESRQVELLPRK